MAAIERVDSMYNIPALTTESEQLEKLLAKDSEAIVELYSNIEKFQGKSNVSSITKNWQDVTTSMTGAATASDALIEIQQKLNEQIARTTALEKQLADAQAKGTQARKARKDMSDQELKASIDANQATKDRIRQLQAEADAYKALELAAANATKTAKTLQATALSTGNPADAQNAAKASAAAKQLNDQLKQISKLGGQDQLNVGNYKEALFQLEQELASVRNSIGKMAGLGDSVGSEMDTAKLHTKALADQIVYLKQKISQLDGSKLTIGNDQALAALSKELGYVNEQMAVFVAGGMENSEEYKELSIQAQALNLILSQQANGFKSVTMQVRSSERALQTLSAVGLEGSEAFNELRTSTNAAARAQQELQRQEKLLESQAPLLKALTLAARGLGGAYAFGAGAATLFAANNEEVQKNINKLVGIMTVLQGLQEMYIFLQESGSIRLAIRNSLVKAATAIQIENTTAVVASNTAVETSTVVAAENTAVIEGQTVAVTELATAAEGAAVAETAAATATTEWGTAFLATGIGAAIAAVALAIGYILSKIPEWTRGTELTIKDQEALAEAMAKANDVMISQAKIMDDLDQGMKKFYEDRLSASSASGENEEKRFALQKALDEEELRLAKDNAAANGATYSELSKQAGILQDLNNKRKESIDLQEALTRHINDVKNAQAGDPQAALGLGPMADRQRDLEKQLKAAQDNQAYWDKQAAGPQALYNATKAALDRIHDAQKKANDDQLHEQNFTDQQRLKLLIESGKIEVDTIKNKNQMILSDDRSTLEEQLKAIDSNAAAAKKAAQLDRISVTGTTENPNTGTSAVDKRLAYQKEAATNQEIERQRAEDARKSRYADYIKREDALEEITASEMQIQQTAAQKILDDEKSTYGQRVKAMYDFYDAQRVTLGAEMGKLLANESLTNEQRLAITKDYDAKISELELKQDQDRDKEMEDERAKELKALQAFYEQRESIVAQEQAKAHVQLMQDLTSGKISPGTYDIKKAQADYHANLSNAQTNVTQAEVQYNQTQPGTQARTAANEEMAKSQMALSDLIADHNKSNIDKTNELEIDAAKETQKMLTSFADDAYENEIRHIEHQIGLNKRYETEQLNRIKATTIGESQKAAASAVITEQAERNQQVLERREMEVKRRQAKFDRDVAVAETIEQGSIAAISALKLEPPFGEIEAVAIGVITAAKVAEILAQPLPAYGFGTEDHPGDLALVGDRFAHELIKEPGRPAYLSPNVPTIVDLPAHTKVIPLDDIARMRDNNMYVNAAGALMMNGDSGMRRVADAINRQTDRLESALSKQRKTVVNKVSVDTNWGHYVQKNVFNWKA